jgi:hypothetical protein
MPVSCGQNHKTRHGQLLQGFAALKATNKITKKYNQRIIKYLIMGAYRSKFGA